MCGKVMWLFVFWLAGLSWADAAFSISGKFERNFGWKVNVTWSKGGDAANMQNITIWRNDQELVVYKLSEDGSLLKRNLTSDNYVANVTCQSKDADQGMCSLWVSITHNATDDIYRAVVRWGSPKWASETVEKEIYQPASRAKIRETQKPGAHQVLNCSSEGVPAPHLTWTLGKGKEIPPDFNQTTWNETSKLWQSWSVYKPTTGKKIQVFCTPRQRSRRGQWKISKNESHLVNFNSAGNTVIVDASGTRVITSILLMAFSSRYAF